MNLQGDFTPMQYDKLLSAKNQLPQAHFHIYWYNDKLLLCSEMQPNGLVLNYSYDTQGRLIESTVGEGINEKILNQYDYKYYND